MDRLFKICDSNDCMAKSATMGERGELIGGLFVVFVVEEEICGIKDEIHRMDKFIFWKSCMLGNVRPFFFYNVYDKI